MQAELTNKLFDCTIPIRQGAAILRMFWKVPLSLSRNDLWRNHCYGQSKSAILLADKAYYTNVVRAFAKQRQAWVNIPAKSNRKGSFPLSQRVYRQRNLAERFFSKLKQFRDIATRYHKDPMDFLAAVKLAAARIGSDRDECAA